MSSSTVFRQDRCSPTPVQSHPRHIYALAYLVFSSKQEHHLRLVIPKGQQLAFLLVATLLSSTNQTPMGVLPIILPTTDTLNNLSPHKFSLGSLGECDRMRTGIDDTSGLYSYCGSSTTLAMQILSVITQLQLIKPAAHRSLSSGSSDGLVTQSKDLRRQVPLTIALTTFNAQVQIVG
ncbi:hypothetical protein PG984_014956 [Apiospora sp. TS-2023a]